jgi:hypothetical protein
MFIFSFCFPGRCSRRGPLDPHAFPYSSLAVSSLLSTDTSARFGAMIADEIKELIHAEPFRPIRIVLGNQQSFIVAHTDYLMISPDRQTVLLYDRQGRFKIINAQQIRLVEPVKRTSSRTPRTP